MVEKQIKLMVARAAAKRLSLRGWLRGFCMVKGDPNLSKLAEQLVEKAERRMRHASSNYGYAASGTRRVR